MRSPRSPSVSIATGSTGASRREPDTSTLRRGEVTARLEPKVVHTVDWVVVAVVVLQSVVHLAVTLWAGRLRTAFDLDTSNGVPDLVSSAVLAAAAVGAALLVPTASRPAVPTALTIGLASLTVADVAHTGPHPGSGIGWLVIVVSVLSALLVLAATRSSGRDMWTATVGGLMLLGSFLVNGLDRIAPSLDRDRGDPLQELQIIAKESFELLGWSLVALALWSAAMRRRARAVATPAHPRPEPVRPRRAA